MGSSNNGAGVIGVAQGTRVLSGKFLGTRGGSTANAIRATDYFTKLETLSNGKAWPARHEDGTEEHSANQNASHHE